MQRMHSSIIVRSCCASTPVHMKRYITCVGVLGPEELSLSGVDPPPRREYRVTWPSNDVVQMISGLRGHHEQSNIHWLVAGNWYTTWGEREGGRGEERERKRREGRDVIIGNISLCWAQHTNQGWKVSGKKFTNFHIIIHIYLNNSIVHWQTVMYINTW